MLVLSRKIKEVIQIGKDIKITVCSIGHDRVKIGIDAPKEVDIKREEIESVEDDSM
jgi:carbon storage regulator